MMTMRRTGTQNAAGLPNTVSTPKNSSSVSHKIQQTLYDPDILHLCIYLTEMELCPPKPYT